MDSCVVSGMATIAGPVQLVNMYLRTRVIDRIYFVLSMAVGADRSPFHPCFHTFEVEGGDIVLRFFFMASQATLNR